MLIKNLKRLLLFIILSTSSELICLLSLPGKPIQNKNDVYLATGIYEYHTSHFWNQHGKRLPAFNDFKRRDYRILLEYGLTSVDTLGFEEGYAQVWEKINSNSRSFTDAELSWKHLVCQNGSRQFITKIVGIVPIMHAYKPGLTYGRFGLEVDGLFLDCFTFRERCGWYQLQLGYRYYQGFPSDQVRFECSAGYHITSRLQLIAASYLEYGVFNGKLHVAKNTLLLDPNYRLLKVEVQALVKIYRDLHGSVGYFQHLWGRNVGTGGGVYGTAYMLF